MTNSRAEIYQHLYELGMAYKSSTHDAVFYIREVRGKGYQVIKFYNNGYDFREGGYHQNVAEAYDEAIHIL